MSDAPAVGLADYRRFYAEEVEAAAGIDDPALVEAFAQVPREHFLGPGPWQILNPDPVRKKKGPAYRETTDADPRRVYHNVLVAIDQSRGFNNGQPSALAAWIHALRLQPGERVLHIGCGLGYYTAIMGHLVGTTGHVVGIELDAELAARARANLTAWPNVEAEQGDGASYDPGPVDVIFVNAGVTHPQRLWLDRLLPNGRMIVPLTAGPGGGLMLLVKRTAKGFAARAVSKVAIYSGAGMRRESSNTLLWASMSKGPPWSVRSLRLDPHERTASCWLHDVDWCLSTEQLPSTAGADAAA